MKDYFIAGLMCLAKTVMVIGSICLALALVYGIVYLLSLSELAMAIAGWGGLCILCAMSLAAFVSCASATVEKKRKTGEWDWDLHD